MSGYKPGYSEQRSPWHDDGVEDGIRDADIMANCPAGAPIGPDPARDRPGSMYMRGYNSVPKVPHVCTRECQKGAA